MAETSHFQEMTPRRIVLLILGLWLMLGVRLPADPPDNEVWVVNRGSLSDADKTMLVTLQGLVSKVKPQIWYKHTGTNYAMTQIMLNELAAEGKTIVNVTSAWQTLDAFRSHVTGYVLYDAGSDSLNVATSLCGPLRSIAVTSSQVAAAEQRGLPLKADVRGKSEAQALTQYWGLMARSVAAELEETKLDHVRDFSVMENAFTYYDGPTSNFRRTVAQTFGPTTLVYGWGNDEYSWIDLLSQGGGGGVAVGLRYNLAPMTRAKVQIPRRPKRYPAPAQPGERIVAFVMSDGDNLRWMLGAFVGETGFWASPYRGTFNMTWELGPMVAEVAPRALRYFYRNASQGEFYDDFVAGPSGAGYTYPSSRPDRLASAEQTGRIMERADMRLISLINVNGSRSSAMNYMDDTRELLDRPEIMGILYKDYAPYNDFEGYTYWRNGKPCVSYTDILWEFSPTNNSTTPAGVAARIAARPANPTTDQDSYSLINVHSWSWSSIGGPMSAIKQTIDLLPPNTRVVTAEELVILLRNNFGEPVPEGYDRTAAPIWPTP